MIGFILVFVLGIGGLQSQLSRIPVGEREKRAMDELVADVVVVGYGGAGASAAIEAHDSGASVLILERADSGGGTTQESSGNIRVIVDHDKAANHYCALTFGTTPRPVMDVFVRGISQIPDWIESLGGRIHETPSDP